MPRPAPAGLTRAAVVDRALAVVTAAGVEALSIRSLAADLGVTPMAIYWHVADKNEILDGVVDATVAAVRTDDLGRGADGADGAGGEPLTELRDLAGRYREAFLRRPGAARVLAMRQGRAAPGPEFLRVAGVSYGLLRQAGLDEGAALSGLMLLGEFLMGAVVTDAGADPAGLAEALGAGPMPGPGERFAFGLDVLLTGLAGAAAPR